MRGPYQDVRSAFVLAGKTIPYGARLSLPARSAASDESEAAYESECRPGGPYGALNIVILLAVLHSPLHVLDSKPG